MITEYLERIQEASTEGSDVKRVRESSKYMWLYHGTPSEAIESIKKNGITANLNMHGI